MVPLYLESASEHHHVVNFWKVLNAKLISFEQLVMHTLFVKTDFGNHVQLLKYVAFVNYFKEFVLLFDFCLLIGILILYVAFKLLIQQCFELGLGCEHDRNNIAHLLHLKECF